jgi:virginiamycin B lyase
MNCSLKILFMSLGLTVKRAARCRQDRLSNSVHPRRFPWSLGIELGLVAAVATAGYALARVPPGTIVEIAIPYLDKSSPGSTHEITYNQNGGDVFWVTGQNYDTLVKVGLNGAPSLYPLRTSSGKPCAGCRPHGIAFDAKGQLWLTLEYEGKIVRVDSNANILAEYNVRLDCRSCPKEINTHPHGLGIGSDGQTVWYTGKATGTVGKITPDGKVQTYPLSIVGSVPIYIRAGPDGNMWVTELVGNAIARVTPDGEVTEFPIHAHNSRPIAIVPEPGGQAMWFTEEAGNNVGRIDMNGKITEFAVPKSQKNVILAGLTFDDQKNLWVQQYVDPYNPNPPGPDYIIKIDRAILTPNVSDVAKIAVIFYQVPTRNTIMHRIIQGPDGNMWFTELGTDKVGKLIPSEFYQHQTLIHGLTITHQSQAGARSIPPDTD